MTDPDIPPDRGGALPTGGRRIRRLEPPGAPWPGWLAVIDGATCMLVEVRELDGMWTWRAPSDGHIAAPRDLIRCAEGHLAVLPVCTERVDGFLARRAGAGIPLSDGEAVTLAVSVLRGTAEALSAGDTGGAQWWLAEDGRPLLVGGEGPPAGEAADAILLALCDGAGPALVHAMDAARERVADPRAVRAGIEDVEAGLFAVAPPEPLATTVLRSEHPRRTANIVPAEPEAAQVGERTPWWQPLVPHVDRSLAELASGALTALWRRVRADRPGRRRHPVLLAGVVGAVVLCVGLLWAPGDDPPATAEGPSPTPSATRTPPRVTPTATGPPDAGADVTAATAALLRTRRACADRSCRARTQEDPRAKLAGGAVELPDEARTLTLLDDFGGAAVLRVHPRDGAEADQFIVVVREDGSWLLRDVRDVTPQP